MRLFFVIFWSFVLGSGTAAAFGAISVVLFKWTSFRFFLHISWNVLSILMIIGFILTTAMIPISIISLETCEVLDEFLDSEEAFLVYPKLLPSDVASKMKVCMFSDGDISKEFNISDSLTQINSVAESLFELDDKTSNSSSSNYLNLNDTSISILYWKTYLNNKKEGLLDDSDYSDNGSAIISIRNLTKWASSSGADSEQSKICNQTNDEWQYNLDNCESIDKWSG